MKRMKPSINCICGARTFYDDPSELRGGRGPHDDGSDCPYVRCDRDDCRALQDPGGHADTDRNCEEYRAAYEHWRRHPYLAGCSHAR